MAQECPDDRSMTALVEGTLEDDALRSTRVHVAACPRCGDELARRLRGAENTAEAATLPETPFARGQPDETMGRGTPVGRYLIIGELGQGGVGVVYAAYDPELHRKVAIKLLRLEQATEDVVGAQRRLLREAQAMARISHPHVRQVYDVGAFRDQVFLAIEFVDGVTLSQWLEERPRPPREVIELFLSAGRGLAAAHAAGLVHRDFKPANVLVGRDGRVRVTDFGLARLLQPPAVPGGVRYLARVVDAGGPDPKRGIGSLTIPGGVLGTTGYMAPEQLLGTESDARADQFSFAVSLHEALWGERPFEDKTFDIYRESVLAGRSREPSLKGGRVPARLRRALARAMSARPEDRFPSMEALLLEVAPPIRRPRWIAAAGVVLLVGAVLATFLSRGSVPPLCPSQAHRLRGVWDDEQKQAVREAFRATGKPFAESASRSVEATLDRYAAEWLSTRQTACEATRVRGEWPENVYALELECLERRLKEQTALVQLFAQADGSIVERAIQASSSLTSIESCQDVNALMGGPAPPANAATRARVEDLRGRLTEAKALLGAGRYSAGLEVAAAVVTDAEVVDYRPLLGEALYARGELESLAGQYEGAVATLLRAVREADVGRHDMSRARAAAYLVGVLGYNLKRTEGAIDVAEEAASALERVGGDEVIEAQLESNLGRTWSIANKFSQALEHHERALALRQHALGTEHADTANSHNNVAVTHFNLGDYASAVAQHHRALAIREKVLGPRHPYVGQSLLNLGIALTSQGRSGEAVRYQERGLEVAESALGSEHPLFYDHLVALSTTLALQGKHEEAKALALRALERCLGAKDAMCEAEVRINLGDVLLQEGRVGEAVAALRRAFVVVSAGRGTMKPKLTVSSLTLLAHAEARAGKPRQAVEWLERAGATLEGYAGSDHPDRIAPLVVRGEVLLTLGSTEDAVEALREALRIAEARRIEGPLLARIRFVRARALKATDHGQGLPRRGSL